MKKSFAIVFLVSLCSSAFGQNERQIVGDFCYFEQINGQKSNGEAMPYSYHSRLEVKFSSGYQISIKDVEELETIVKNYASKTGNQKILLGEYKPESIGVGTKVADVKSKIKIFWDANNLILEIPELTDMFGNDSAPNHTVFIPKDCISKFLDCLRLE